MKFAHVLRGCRPDSFLSYFKALGVFRVLAKNLDSTARFAFREDAAIVHTERSRQEIEEFFLVEFSPTPILNPWNKGSGLLKGAKSPGAEATVASILATQTSRFAAYREAITVATAAIETANLRGPMNDADKKKLIVALYRARCPEAALEWLDSAIILGASQTSFPPLMGSGGNDGRLDFGVNFAENALIVTGEAVKKGIVVADLLRDAFDGTGYAMLLRGSGLGQFAPATAAMFNSGNSTSSSPLSNPWDYVLTFEGAVAFSGALVKRASAYERPSFPFMFTSVAAGFGSASSSEDTHGEVWLPIWRGTASWSAIAALLRRGRLEVDVSDSCRTSRRVARSSFDAVYGALTLGVASGIERLERVVLLKRNGLAFTGTSAGAIVVRDRVDPAFSSLSRETLQWISHTRNKQIGSQAAVAIRSYEDAVYAYAATRFEGVDRRVALQEMIVALGSVDRAVALAPPKEHRPLPFLDESLLDIDGPLDDGSAEHRIARALASYGGHRGANLSSQLRFDLVGVRLGSRNELEYGHVRETLWRPDTLSMLASICARRARDVAGAKDDSDAACMLSSESFVNESDFEELFAGEVDIDRVGRLLLGYALITPKAFRILRGGYSRASLVDGTAKRADFKISEIPCAFALLKLAFDRTPHPNFERTADGQRRQEPLDAELVSLLLTGLPDRAINLAARRLRASGFAPRDASGTDFDPLTYAAFLLVPASRGMIRTCARRALLTSPFPSRALRTDVAASDAPDAPNAQESFK